MPVDVTSTVFYCLRRRPPSSEGEDLCHKGGGEIQTKDRLQGKVDGRRHRVVLGVDDLLETTRIDYCANIYI